MPGMGMKASLALFLGCSFFLAGGTQENKSDFRELAELEKSGAKVSAMIVDLDSGAEIAQIQPRRSLTPASVTKALLAAAVLDVMGPEGVFQTEIYFEGKRKGDVLDGDLVILAGGDPGLTNEYLWRLTTDVSRLGIRKISGNLILDVGRFETIPPESRDANRAIAVSGSSHAYDSPLSAGAVNFSVLGVFAAPSGTAGQPASVALEPYPLSTVRLKNEVRTTAAGPSRLSVVRSTKGDEDVITASGNVVAGAAPRTLYRSVSDPDRYATDVYRSFFAAAGVEVGSVAIRRSGVAKGKPVLKLDSQPVEWQLRGLLRMSNNFIADMLTIHLGLRTQDRQEKGTLAAGNKALETYVRSVLAKGERSSDELVRIVSGSGLTPENKISAGAVVDVLTAVYHDPDSFAHLYASLPGAGLEGTLRDRFQDKEAAWLKGRLRAKTGTLTEPQTAVGLAGYARSRGGRWVAFGLLVNGGVGVERARSAIERDLGKILGEF